MITGEINICSEVRVLPVDLLVHVLGGTRPRIINFKNELLLLVLTHTFFRILWSRKYISCGPFWLGAIPGTHLAESCEPKIHRSNNTTVYVQAPLQKPAVVVPLLSHMYPLVNYIQKMWTRPSLVYYYPRYPHCKARKTPTRAHSLPPWGCALVGV